MTGRAIIVIDVGKTFAKLTLWDRAGALIEQRTRANAAGPDTLDAAGIEDWLAGTLADFAKLADVGAIIPVAHGAAAALVCRGKLLLPPRDYEAVVPAAVRAAYDAERAAFAETGSPALPAGLNLGVQLFQQMPFPAETQILLWPQYWSWRLSGIASREVTSLGCHSDLWNPAMDRFSSLAARLGWAKLFPPRAQAGDVLGSITPEWVARTGLPAGCQIHCGLHDSNAALVAARGFPEIAGHEATIVSTGTWFVALRSVGGSSAEPVDLTTLPETRDCLVNVDVDGRPVPSARFMGGREVERLGARIDQSGVEGLAAVLASRAMILPGFAPGCGPFPRATGRWLREPAETAQRRAAIALYAALVTDCALDLIGSRETLLIEGRFATAELFVRALATLRPDMAVYASAAAADVAFGALRLIDPSIKPSGALAQVTPLESDLGNYKAEWHRHIKGETEHDSHGG